MCVGVPSHCNSYKVTYTLSSGRQVSMISSLVIIGCVTFLSTVLKNTIVLFINMKNHRVFQEANWLISVMSTVNIINTQSKRKDRTLRCQFKRNLNLRICVIPYIQVNLKGENVKRQHLVLSIFSF